MKKFLLITSIILSLLFSNESLQVAKATSNEFVTNLDCNAVEKETVRIVNKYGKFVGSGVVYSIKDEYAYIVTSDDISISDDGNRVIYNDEVSKGASFVGKDTFNNVMVLKAGKSSQTKGVCLANSYYFVSGQLNIIYGYKSIDERYVEKTFLGKQGVTYYKKDYITVYKNIIQTQYEDYKEGMPISDELGRFVGLLTRNDEKLNQKSYSIDSNKLTKIVESIVNSRKYEPNYIKYNSVDYSSLGKRERSSYKVSEKAQFGAVITTFKPLNYVFGGLNQGMVIQTVNSVEIRNTYDLDNQLSRYEKGSTVCLGVLKKNGKIAYYYVKI